MRSHRPAQAALPSPAAAPSEPISEHDPRGNAAVQDQLRSTGPGTSVEGLHLADLDLTDGIHRRREELVGRAELLPADGSAEGYRSLIQAILRGREVDTTTVVAQDAGSRYHVVDTGLAPLPSTSPDGSPWQVQEHLFGVSGGLSAVRVVRALDEGEVDYDATRARAERDRDQAREDHLIPSYDRAEASAEDQLRAVVGRSLSVGHRREDPTLTTRGDLAVDVEPTNADSARARSGLTRVPRDPRAPEPAVQRPTFNRPGLTSRNAVEQTLIHEGTHVAHAERTLELRRRWQASGARTSFEAWLAREARAGRLSEEDSIVAGQSLDGDTGATEVLARVEAFASTFHRHAPDDRDAFVQLRTLPTYWSAPSGSDLAYEPLRRLALERLFACYQALDEPHRQAFDRFVADPTNFPGNDERPFEVTRRGRQLLVPALQAFRHRL